MIKTFFRTASYGFAALLLWIALPSVSCGQTAPQTSDAAKTAEKPEPFKVLTKLADGGDTAAAFELGQRYILGEGLPKDTDKGIHYITSAANKGLTKAAVYLANQYRVGKHLPKDTESMLTWYTKAAEAGDAPAAYELGHLHETGKEGIPVDPERSQKWYSTALPLMEKEAAGEVTRDNSDLAFWAGIMHSTGRGTKPSQEKAFLYWQKAALAGHTLAQRQIGLAYLNGTGTTKNYQEAKNWLTKAAEQGDIPSLLDRVVAIEKADGPKAAENELDNLAKLAPPELIMEIALIYKDGTIIPKNPEKAFLWATKAAESNNANALYMLGSAYLNGEGTGRNFWKAYQAFKAAAAQGIAPAEQQASRLKYIGLAGIALVLCLVTTVTLFFIRKRKIRALQQQGANNQPSSPTNKK